MDAHEEVSEIRKIQRELLWGLYQELRNHARHSETQRATAINYALVIASALTIVILFDRQINRYDLTLSLLISFIGLLSALFSLLYTELYWRNRERASRLLERLDTLFFKDQAPNTLSEITNRADEIHRKTKIYFWGRRIAGSTHLYWIGLPLVIGTIGIVLTILSWLRG
jgi:energy-converting hydrogenase Eha subunit A